MTLLQSCPSNPTLQVHKPFMHKPLPEQSFGQLATSQRSPPKPGQQRQAPFSQLPWPEHPPSAPQTWRVVPVLPAGAAFGTLQSCPSNPLMQVHWPFMHMPLPEHSLPPSEVGQPATSQTSPLYPLQQWQSALAVSHVPWPEHKPPSPQTRPPDRAVSLVAPTCGLLSMLLAPVEKPANAMATASGFPEWPIHGAAADAMATGLPGSKKRSLQSLPDHAGPHMHLPFKHKPRLLQSFGQDWLW
mmetsp:Transcript_55789/g.103210  ORF Transcript_55789/g.103210 Transcript_55789/m.103210 type:complete len:243 (-) Transcript_55789:2088-2816(-)